VNGLTLLLFQTVQGYSWASECSADGSVIVGIANYDPNGNSAQAFMWDAVHGMRTIAQVAAAANMDLQGFQPIEATSISADGKVICGWGFSSRGQEAWVLDLRSKP
jgi:uncharacterized membrane protein